MKTHQREIMIYYNPDSSADRKTVAHAQSLTPHIKSYSFGRTPSTGTSWQMILKALDLHPKEILNKAHPYYQAHIRGREFDNESWVKVLRYNPDLIKAPIAIRGKKAILCTNPTDIYKLLIGQEVKSSQYLGA
ncbi:MAG: ArsC/Spx/MgsR family protein [Bacteroidota bacterium]